MRHPVRFTRAGLRPTGRSLAAAATAAVGVMGALVTTAAVPAASAASSPPAARPVGSAPALPSDSVRVGDLAAGSVLHLDVVLTPQDPSGLQTYAASVSTPGSPDYHHFLSVPGFAARFGAGPAQESVVRSALTADGLRPGPLSANGLSIPVEATARQIDTAFGVGLARYRLPTGRVGYANTAAPRLAASAAPYVQGIVGLDDVHQRQPDFAGGPGRSAAGSSVTGGPAPGRVTRSSYSLAPQTTGPQACATARNVAALAGSYTAADLASAYSFPGLYGAGDLGAGTTIALFELEPNAPSDIAAYQACYGTHTSVGYVPVDGGVGSGTGEGEAALDIETVIGLAPAASILVYQGPNSAAGSYDTYSAIIGQNRANVVSVSWGSCEADVGSTVMAAENVLFQEAAVQGQSILASSGDTGSEGCFQQEPTNTSLSVNDPASQPFVTSVGGTTLLGPTAPPQQVVWNDNYDGDGATGGGPSGQWARPGYQSTVAPAGTRREVPDVSADADPETGYTIEWDGEWGPAGGTSATAPLWASLVALADSRCPATSTTVGFANPALYSLAGTHPSVFTDVGPDTAITPVNDNDYTATNAGQYPTLAGYDMTTGLGTPVGSDLVTQLCQLDARPGGTYTPVAPTRLMDTRINVGARGPVGANATLTLPVTGRGGVPASGVAAVALNVTVTQSASSGNVAVYADGAARPGTSNVNFAHGRTVANLVVAPVGADGKVDLATQSPGTVQLIVDLAGWYVGGTPSGGGAYTAVAPTRLMDTRIDQGAPGPVAANGTVILPVAGQAGVPASGVAAVVLNVTATQPSNGGNVAVFADGATRPGTSNVNFVLGKTVANLVVAPVGADGSVDLAAQGGPVQLIVDVSGWFSAGASSGAGAYTAVAPTRLMDTRINQGATGPVPPNGSVRLAVAGQAGVPASGVAAVILNVTATHPLSGGNVAVYGDGTLRPGTSNVNFALGESVANLVVAPVGADGRIVLATQSAGGSVQLIVDVAGWVSGR